MTLRARLVRLLRHPAALAAVAALALAIIPAHAGAQFMGAGADMGALGMTRIGRRSVEGYGRILGMDPQQLEAALALQEGYAESHRAATKKFQDDMHKIQEEFQDTQDFSVFQKKMPKMAVAFGEEMEELEKGFLTDLKALLTSAQEEKWPRVERMRRREGGLRYSMVSGQGVDLLDVLDDLKIDGAASPELADQLDRYEMEVDKSLVAMEKWGKDQQKDWLEGEDAFDFSKMQEMMKKAEEMMAQMSERARAIRDVNRQYARAITPLLPADQQPKFDHEIKRRSFPRVYRTPWVSKALGAADGFTDLTPEQKSTLAEIRQGYERELAAANTRWAAAIEAREEKTGGSMLAMMQGMRGEGADADDVTDARKARRELDDRYTAKLNEVLSQDQAARLPEDKREPRENDWGMFAVDDLEGQEDDEDDPR